MNASDWKLDNEDKKEGLTVWQKQMDNLKCMKAAGMINHSPKNIFRCLGDESYKRIYDSSYDEGKMIDRIADQMFLVSQKSKKVSIVASRDFVLTIYSYMAADGTIYGIAFDADMPGLVPETKGVIRASTAVSENIDNVSRLADGSWNRWREIPTSARSLTSWSSTSRETYRASSSNKPTRTSPTKWSSSEARSQSIVRTTASDDRVCPHL